MGLLDDTLHDAARPLPRLTLQRSAGPAGPELEPPGADEGASLTVFRLQKEGGDHPPVAPPAPRAVDAGAPVAGPIHAPVGNFYDASLQFVTSIDGLETGEEPVRTRNSDATDRQQSLRSPDPSQRLHFVASAGSAEVSSQVPFPFDDPGKLVQRIDSSDGMRRATGRGAPSGDPLSAPAQPERADASTAPLELAERVPSRNTVDVSASPPLAGDSPAGTSFTPATPLPANRAQGATARAAEIPAPPPQAARAAAQQRPAPLAGPHASPPAEQAASPALQIPASGPRLSIGRIEVTVLAAAPAAKAPAPRPDAFLSTHYLRRL